jgi:hypothetical protein
MPKGSPIYVKVPCTCQGTILDRTDDMKNAGYWAVKIYKSPKGEIERCLCKLAFNPGGKRSFKTGMNVIVLVYFFWDANNQDYVDACQDTTNLIVGVTDTNKIIDLEMPNPNTDLEGDIVSFLHPSSDAGLLCEKGGAVRLVTSSKVIQEMCPHGEGIMEELHRIYAHNFHRVISAKEMDGYAREFFGISYGVGLEEKVAKATKPDNILCAYRRFVPQSLRPDIFVSTCEGTFDPYLGPNNSSDTLDKKSEIIFNKVINYKNNRISVFAGETGPGFFNFRIDYIPAKPLMGEDLDASGNLTPVLGYTAFYLGISEEGELKMEAGVDTKTKQPAMTLSIAKTGEVDIKVGKSFKINGKELLTKDFLDFMVKHQADLVQVAAIGAPAPMSPAAEPDFTKGQQPGSFLTDKPTNDLVTAAPFLQSS